MYTIENFNNKTQIMTFRLNNNNLIEINLIKSYSEYCPVPQDLYINTTTEEVVKMGYPNNRRVINIDNDGTVYRRCSQYECDRNEFKMNYDSDNAKIYKFLSDKQI